MATDFCTYFDSGYLPRAIVLYWSLQRHVPEARLFAVCMDEESFAVLSRLNWPRLIAIRRSEFERGDEALSSLAASRTTVEYYFTCTSSVVLYVLKHNRDIHTLFYVDADMWFCGDAAELIDDMRDSSVYIVEHRFPESQQHLAVYGRFNVGILGFRNDTTALECLQEWRRQCIEWCFDVLDGDRFADQKYLDHWPFTCTSLRIAQHPGVNVAPWNKERYLFSRSSQGVFVDDRNLICFHFQGLRQYEYGFIEPQALDYGSKVSPECLSLVFKPYLAELRHAGKLIGKRSQAMRYGREPEVRDLWRTRRNSPYLLCLGKWIWQLNPWNVVLFMIWLKLAKMLSGISKNSVA